MLDVMTSPGKKYTSAATSPIKLPPRPIGYTEEFRIREMDVSKETPRMGAEPSGCARVNRFDEVDSIVLETDPPPFRLKRTLTNSSFGSELRPLEELPALSTRRNEEPDRSYSSMSYTSLKRDLETRARQVSPNTRTLTTSPSMMSGR
jgi:hypothetical protein